VKRHALVLPQEALREMHLLEHQSVCVRERKREKQREREKERERERERERKRKRRTKEGGREGGIDRDGGRYSQKEGEEEVGR
jgi:hypothetical protein